jgi:hypothetical protein
MSKLKDIIKFVEKNSYQYLDGSIENFEGENEIEFTTREHGNVGDEEYSQIDFDDAQEIGVKLIAEFGIKGFDIETCDEWVNLTIILK